MSDCNDHLNERITRETRTETVAVQTTNKVRIMFFEFDCELRFYKILDCPDGASHLSEAEMAAAASPLQRHQGQSRIL